ncbi:MAG: hypothetical protein QOE28_1518 [Solirubrobacteraceae bacterium]|jgi:soluble lytic murein transglycosylase-like protein|nr:hypothetical protein [Solirubrobacteraceae bacterium]
MSRLIAALATAVLALGVALLGGAAVVLALAHDPEAPARTAQVGAAPSAAGPGPRAAASAAPPAAGSATPAPTSHAGPPAPDARLAGDPAALASDLAATHDALYRAIDAWQAAGAHAIPGDLTLYALHEQRIYRTLGTSPRLARGVLAALPARLRAEARDNVVARRELELIKSVAVGPPPKIALGPAQSADLLRAHYRDASARFGVAPEVLAAVNFVESAFGRLRNRSVSGARGPMQFMPATWAAYGLGGDISDPADAVLGAANYLHANGAPANERGALLHYNPSSHYVEAISRYARRIRADWRAYYDYYAWPVFYRGRQLTGPGR